ncbi:MFS transporter (plasmid) [Clostridium butyricum]|mgnify:FL=1|jgi:MFS family permease|uniref:MFS transporter n=1 Tax=Clostridium butyricum TaxID=1492 RepID=UPI0002CA249D|nr:MFS transporter [Clostridium butyricum]ETI87708.1 MAG: Major facilitator superfamily MFS_1 [Clostridium butyricum DORA_1]EMU52760.1 major facilitator superfamily transporter [Clostridium butyricum DKU-01]MDU1005730.1 MFS transporter [Clostridium butyricum]MDU1508208.1 MFS transporter [Clostridium butyricum]MDU4802226.1 MFS transporter [Clostridium butyricum]
MKNKNFIIIVIGQIISLFGNAVQRFSMSLYLLHFTGSTAAFAKILAISTIPYIIFAPIAGRLSDKINKKKIMIYLDLFCAALIGGYALILLNGMDSEFVVGAVMFILSICYTLYGPAVTSSIPQIVNEDRLTSANGIINQVGSAVNFVGPILAGVLYGLVGIKFIVIINAVSFLMSAILELFLDIPDAESKTNNVIGKDKLSDDYNSSDRLLSFEFVKNSFIDMKNTFMHLMNENKIILGIIVSYALGNIFLVPILSIVAPYFINIYLGLPSEIYGIVEGICVLGMICGGFWISIKPEMFSMKKVHYTYVPMILGVALMSVIVFLKINNYAMAGLFSLSGMAIMMSLSLSNVLTLTFIQKEISMDMLGSVSALSTAVATISVAPGQLLFGQAIDSGIPIGMILLITLCANFCLVLFIRWNVRKLK